MTNISTQKITGHRKSTDKRALHEGTFDLIQTRLDASQRDARNQMAGLRLWAVVLTRRRPYISSCIKKKCEVLEMEVGYIPHMQPNHGQDWLEGA